MRTREEDHLINSSEREFRPRKLIWTAVAVIAIALFTVAFSLFFLIRNGKINDKSDNLSIKNCKDNAILLNKEALGGDSYLWNKLAYMADTFGPRLSGSEGLNLASGWVFNQMVADGLENVTMQAVKVNYWVRGNESAILHSSKRTKVLSILGLGLSVGTSGKTIRAPVLVVKSFDELKQKCSDAAGKIVVFNQNFVSYGETVAYRGHGADAASECGALAALVRSITPYSLYTPHTGVMWYNGQVSKIPTASVTVEDALMMQRMQDRNDTLSISLYMEANNRDPATAHNIMGQITGSQFPNEVIVIGGHIDSWDVGEGAMDDGGGLFVSWEAVRLMIKLGMRPKRTIRVVAFVNEEDGAEGGDAYATKYGNETIFAIESDIGVTKPTGFAVVGSNSTLKVLREITQGLLPNSSNLFSSSDAGTDLEGLMSMGIPGAGLMVDQSKYFYYHHSNADTMDKLDPKEMNQCVAVMAVTSYCIAQLDQNIPK
eukprot:TRINITY_DN1383_c0_g1_i1.p1 TRINITY_DN1383_c0_g1~~TRINITY_DN1383_c0_g1_i1.p1  ORF type:complete len:507 (+),score=150.98 TRINITY_DN1383_c0_g1_i1:61-1521(+)